MYAFDGPSFQGQLSAFWGAVATIMPDDVQILVESTGDLIEASDGHLTGSWTSAAGTPHTGGSAAGYAGPVGALLRWETGVVQDGSRIRGRSFIVPLAGASYDTDGTLEPGVLAALQTDAAALVAATVANFAVWHRPFDGAPAVGTKPARPAHIGSALTVTGSSVPDKAVVLRSRRG